MVRQGGDPASGAEALVPMLAFDIEVAEQRVLDDLLPHLAG